MLRLLRNLTMWLQLSNEPVGVSPRPLRDRLQVFIGIKKEW